MKWRPVIGLEIHAQLLTRTKLFCGCPTRFGTPANTQVCPICLGHPGVLPRLNRRAVELALRVGIGLDAEIRPVSIFTRKNYFYPDLPKGYQITQFRRPLGEGGTLRIGGTGTGREVPITRIHLEEDAGRSHHLGGADRQTRLDLNRCGIPLVEIVTEPVIDEPQAAAEFVRRIRRLLMWLDACDGNMESGSLRCDANISLRPEGSNDPGARTELKNLNSTRFLRRALEHEIARQTALLEGGETPVRESRYWDEVGRCTVAMRGKEEAPDYRYFPEPDLPPLEIPRDWIDEIRRNLPELPEHTAERFRHDYGLPEAEAEFVTAIRPLAEYFEAVVEAGAEPRKVSNWIVNEPFLEAIVPGVKRSEPAIPPESFALLLREMASGRLSRRQAKEVLIEAIERGVDPGAIVERLGTKQISDPRRIERWIERVLDTHPDQLDRYLAGKSSLFRFFVGEVMKASRGEANPGLVSRLLDEALEQRRDR